MQIILTVISPSYRQGWSISIKGQRSGKMHLSCNKNFLFKSQLQMTFSAFMQKRSDSRPISLTTDASETHCLLYRANKTGIAI